MTLDPTPAQLQEALDAVRVIHQPVGRFCGSCGDLYPCPTRRAMAPVERRSAAATALEGHTCGVLCTRASHIVSGSGSKKDPYVLVLEGSGTIVLPDGEGARTG